MNAVFSPLFGAARDELLMMRRSPLLIFLTVVQAITFLLLVSLFGLTGSRAPTAVINEDTGPYSKIFIAALLNAHHSFNLQPMTQEQATEKLQTGELVASITIPGNFSNAITYGETDPVRAAVDNVDTDLTEDIQRALPSAITTFAKKVALPGISIQVKEHDLINHDTGFIPYLVVSALALDAFVVSGILSAIAIAQEFETGTVTLLAVAPVSPMIPFLGRILITNMVSLLVMLLSAAIVVFGYGVVPLHPIEMFLGLCLCIIIFGSIGVALGVAIKQTLPVASLIFGLALPLYIDSGSLEPERFDGNVIWTLAHLSPIYYAVGVLEHAFHGFRVTPEPIFVDVIMLGVWAACLLLISGWLIRRELR